MKNNIKDYVGLSKEDEKFLREFDDAIERGYFKDKKVKFTKKMKKEIEVDRGKFKQDLMFKNKRSYAEVDGIVLNQKPYVGKKKRPHERDELGKFSKKDEK